MFGSGRPYRYGRRRRGFGFSGGFFLPFTIGALAGAALRPPFSQYYPPYYSPYYPYPYY